MCQGKDKKIIERLLLLLDDADVQKKICRIVASTKRGSELPFAEDQSDISHCPVTREDERKKITEGKLTQLLTENKTLLDGIRTEQQKLKDTQRKVEVLRQEAELLRQQNDDLKEEIKTQTEKLKEQHSLRSDLNLAHEELCKYKEASFQFNRIYELFSQLPERVKEGLKGIFNSSSLCSFVVCGVQKDNLLSLWDYCKTEFDRGKTESYDTLLEIFLFFFDLLKQSVSGTFVYELQQVSIGDVFNKDLHSIAGMGIAAGKISKVVLPGIIYANNKKIYKKSLVEVK